MALFKDRRRDKEEIIRRAYEELCILSLTEDNAKVDIEGEEYSITIYPTGITYSGKICEDDTPGMAPPRKKVIPYHQY